MEMTATLLANLDPSRTATTTTTLTTATRGTFTTLLAAWEKSLSRNALFTPQTLRTLALCTESKIHLD